MPNVSALLLSVVLIVVFVGKHHTSVAAAQIADQILQGIGETAEQNGVTASDPLIASSVLSTGLTNTRNFNTSSISSTVTGLSSLQSCNSERQRYAYASGYLTWGEGGSVDGVSYSTYEKTLTTILYSSLCSEMCPGLCLVTSSTPTATETHSTITSDGILTLPSPTCVINKDDCNTLWTSYFCVDAAASSSPLLSSCSPYVTTPLPGGDRYTPECPDPRTTDYSGCRINPGTIVELIHWEITANASRNMCATTLTDPGTFRRSKPSPTIPTARDETAGQPSAVISGTTFYANSAYLRYPSVWAQDATGKRLGTMLTNVVVTLESSAISSYREPGGQSVWSFNWADLKEPVPWIAWLGQARLFSETALSSTEIPGSFQPHLEMPIEALTLQPEWSKCDFVSGYVHDPPIAVQAVKGGFTGVTSVVNPGPGPTSTPEPAQSVVIPLPVQTSPDPGPTGNPLPASSAVDPANPAPASSAIDPANPPPASSAVDPASPGVVASASFPQDPGATGNSPPPSSAVTPVNPASPNAPLSPAPVPATPTPIATVGGSTVIFDPTASAITVGTQVLPSGAVTTIGGTRLSIGSGVVVVGSSTIALPTAPSVLIPSLTIGISDSPLITAGATYILSPSGLLIVGPSGTQTLPVTVGQGGFETVTAGGKVYVVSVGAGGQVMVGVSTLGAAASNVGATTNGFYPQSTTGSVEPYTGSAAVRFGFFGLQGLLLICSFLGLLVAL